MTREEAIEVIQNFMGWFKPDSRIYKALKMAISAMLENEELSKDLDEALKEIDGYERGLSQEPTFDDECQKDMDEAWEQIQKKRKRIPVTLDLTSCDDTYNIRKDILKCRVGNIVAYNVEWLKKHWQMEMDIVCGVKPCTDAVSRDAVLNAIEHEDKWLLAAKGHNGLTEIAFSGLKARVDALPSVTQKSGKWNEYYTSQKGNNVFNCKECGHTFVVTQGKDNMNFCPNCGAKMESEDKE